MTQTIGQRLKAEREEQRLTLEKVFEATRIRVQYLQALEEDDPSVMPSPVQARGYLRNYAEFLGFDVEQMLHDLRELNAQPASTEVIGPADLSSPSPAPETTKTVEVEVAEELLPSFNVVPEVPVIPEPTVPIKPKPVRRKKTAGIDSPAQPTVAEPATRR